MKIDRKSLVKEMRAYIQAENELKKVEAEMKSQIQSIKTSFQEQVNKWLHIRALASERLQMVAFYHYDELFAEEKSIDLQYGCIGFRKSEHKVVKKGSSSWEEIYAQCEKIAPGLLRVKKELNKAKILALKEQPQTMAQLKEVGISVLQDEYFFVCIYNKSHLSA